MDILFRKDRKTNEVVAFIPESTVNYGHILSYMHIGQHSEASLQYYWETVKATEEEQFETLVRNVVAYAISNNSCKTNWIAQELLQDVIPDELIAEIFNEE